MTKQKKGKILFLLSGLGVLIILIGVAFWLTIHMMNLSQRIDRSTMAIRSPEVKQTVSSSAAAKKKEADTRSNDLKSLESY